MIPPQIPQSTWQAIAPQLQMTLTHLVSSHGHLIWKFAERVVEIGRGRIESYQSQKEAAQQVRTQLEAAHQSYRSQLEQIAAAQGMPLATLVDLLRSLVNCPFCGTPTPHLETKGEQRCEHCGREFFKYQCPICRQWYTSGILLFEGFPCGICGAAGKSEAGHDALLGIGIPDEQQYHALLDRAKSLDH
jgi:hypothetical protein